MIGTEDKVQTFPCDNTQLTQWIGGKGRSVECGRLSTTNRRAIAQRVRRWSSRHHLYQQHADTGPHDVPT